MFDFQSAEFSTVGVLLLHRNAPSDPQDFSKNDAKSTNVMLR